MSDQGNLRCRKLALIALIVVVIIVDILVTIYVVTAVDKTDIQPDRSSGRTLDKQTEEGVKSVMKTSVIAGCIITILIHMLGLFGAYFEHFCLTLTYAILMTLATLGSIFGAIQSPIKWFDFILFLIITILAYILARDIKQVKGDVQCCCCSC